MTSNRLRRASALGAASLLAGAGLVGLVASPAFAVSVSNHMTLVDAINNGDTVIDIANDFALEGSLPDITGPVVINGNGFTIDADGNPGFSLSLTGSDSVTILDLTIVDPTYGIDADLSDTSDLTVTGVDIVNPTGEGANIYAEDTPTAELTEVNVSGGSNYGIYLESYYDADATFEVADSSATDNLYGLYFYGYGTSTATVTNTDLSRNGYYGLYTDMYDDAGMTLRVENSTINDNDDYGVYLCDMAGQLTIVDTTIDGNGSYGIEGSIYSEDGGTLSVLSSTISNNSDGAVDLYSYYEDSYFYLVNSTVSGNDGSDENYAAVYVEGDDYENSGVYVLNSTITANTNVWAGLYVSDVPTLVSHSIVSGNDVGSYGDIYDDSLSDYEIEWSIVDIYEDVPPASGLEAASYVEGDGVIFSTDPGLAPLADNGGPTLTHLPLETSAAINAGDPDAAAGVGDISDFDQRGLDRVRGTAIDIGAVEVQEELLAATGAEASLGVASGVALLALGLGLVGYRIARRRQTV